MADRSGDTWAPIALLIFNRADHARRTITSLQACTGFAESPIHVYADGPRHERDRPAVASARAVARELLGDRAVFVESETNLGIPTSVIGGVTELCERYGRVIVVEDDLVVAPYFLQFLNDALRHYANDPRVMQVSGHMYDVPALRSKNEALFLRWITTWGWGTWKRAWDHFDPEAGGWQDLLRDEGERKRFDLNGRVNSSTRLEVRMQEKVPGWEIRWYYTVYTHGGLVLFPPQTLVVNMGLDGSGTHHRLGLPVRQAPLGMSTVFRLPPNVAESSEKEHVYDAIQAFMPRGTWQKIKALPHVFLHPETRARTYKAATARLRIQSSALVRQLFGYARRS